MPIYEALSIDTWDVAGVLLLAVLVTGLCRRFCGRVMQHYGAVGSANEDGEVKEVRSAVKVGNGVTLWELLECGRQSFEQSAGLAPKGCWRDLEALDLDWWRSGQERAREC
jgi:hypothetical protein